KPGRGPERGTRLAARAPRFVLAPAVVDHQPHPDAGGVPARGAQPAEMRARGRRLVEMKGLRIEARREGFDIFGGEGVAAELALLADANVLEELHGLLAAFGSPAALAARPPHIRAPIQGITGPAAALERLKRHFEKPNAG